MKKIILLATVASMGLATAAMAAPQRHLMMNPDANGDGKVTLAELEARSAEHFAKLDGNGDGILTSDELQEAREARKEMVMEKREARADMMFEKLDADGNGAISRDEFDSARAKRAEMGEHHPRGKRGEGRHGERGEMLKRADANQDGQITLAEFQAPMKAHFTKVDANGDGVIDKAEHDAAGPKRRHQRD